MFGFASHHGVCVGGTFEGCLISSHEMIQTKESMQVSDR